MHLCDPAQAYLRLLLERAEVTVPPAPCPPSLLQAAQAAAAAPWRPEHQCPQPPTAVHEQAEAPAASHHAPAATTAVRHSEEPPCADNTPSRVALQELMLTRITHPVSGRHCWALVRRVQDRWSLVQLLSAPSPPQPTEQARQAVQRAVLQRRRGASAREVLVAEGLRRVARRGQ